MGRPERDIEPGSIYHVSSRGNNGETTFRRTGDRHVFLGMLDRVAARHGWTILAYCLMTNHYHLVIRAGERGLSDGMRELNGPYARWVNRRYGRAGHLWRNRFFSVLLETEAHALLACRYIVLNAVRARICRMPEEYVWSSYRASAGLTIPPRFLRVGELLQLFAGRAPTARSEYRAFVAEGIAEIAAATSG